MRDRELVPRSNRGEMQWTTGRRSGDPLGVMVLPKTGHVNASADGRLSSTCTCCSPPSHVPSRKGQRRHRPHGPADLEDPRCFASSSRSDRDTALYGIATRTIASEASREKSQRPPYGHSCGRAYDRGRVAHALSTSLAHSAVGPRSLGARRQRRVEPGHQLGQRLHGQPLLQRRCVHKPRSRRLAAGASVPQRRPRSSRAAAPARGTREDVSPRPPDRNQRPPRPVHVAGRAAVRLAQTAHVADTRLHNAQQRASVLRTAARFRISATSSFAVRLAMSRALSRSCAAHSNR
jgi:hypothetical protein